MWSMKRRLCTICSIKSHASRSTSAFVPLQIFSSEHYSEMLHGFKRRRWIGGAILQAHCCYKSALFFPIARHLLVEWGTRGPLTAVPFPHRQATVIIPIAAYCYLASGLGFQEWLGAGLDTMGPVGAQWATW